MAKNKRKAAYVVSRGRRCGVFVTWDETSALVHGFPGAKYKGYATRGEAERAWQEKSAIRASAASRTPAASQSVTSSTSSSNALVAASMPKRKRNGKVAYVVFRGRQCGVFETWEDVAALVRGFPGAKCQGYATRGEAERAWREEAATAPAVRAGLASRTPSAPTFVRASATSSSSSSGSRATATGGGTSGGAPAAAASVRPPWARHTRGFGADQLEKMGYAGTGAAPIEVTLRPQGAGLGFDGADARAVELTDEQEKVCAAAMAGDSLFFTGSAGTGKTTTMRALIARLQQRSLGAGTGKVFVTASTGAAAVLCGGTTLHSFAGVGLGEESAGFLISKLPKLARKRWNVCSTLIIDEISMIDGDLLDKIDAVARAARGEEEESNWSKPFGGVQVIVSGDFMQLPPVRVSRFAFEAQAWRATFGVGAASRQFCLARVFRQRDPAFVDLLNELRVGRASPATCAALRATAARGLSAAHGIEPTKLFARNDQVDAVNRRKLSELPGAETTLCAKDEGDARRIQQCSYPSELLVKEQAQIMLLHNVDVKRGLVNGSRGVITAIERDPSGEVVAIPCKFTRGGHHVVRREEATVEEAGKVLASRTQFPLRLAWALSIHKSQGQTIDLLDCDLRGCFEDGQAYTAVSRAVDLERVVVRNFSPEIVLASKQCLDFDAGLRRGAAAVGSNDSQSQQKQGSLRFPNPNQPSKQQIQPEGRRFSPNPNTQPQQQMQSRESSCSTSPCQLQQQTLQRQIRDGSPRSQPVNSTNNISHTLTQEQRLRIEENRKRAMAIRMKRQQGLPLTSK